MIVSLTSTGGCATYLHNPTRAIATADLKTKFGELSTPAYFEAQEKNLAGFAAREDRAVAEFMVASRDYRLLNVLDTGTTDQQLLGRYIREDLKSATGQSDLTPAEVQGFTAKRFMSRLADATLRTNLQQIQGLAKDYREKDGKLPTACDAVVANPAPPHGRADQKELYDQLVRDCARLRRRQAVLDGCNPRPLDGTLADVCRRIDDLANDLSNAQRSKELQAAEKALLKALEADPDPNRVKKAQDLISALQGLADNERLQAILTQLDAVFGRELQVAIDEVNRTGKAALARYSDPVMTALQLFDAIESVSVEEQSRAGDKSSALLIGLAKVRHDLNLANIDIAAKAAEVALLRDQVAALHNQIYYLGEAQSSIAKGSADKALNHFVYSVNKGQIPYRVAEFRFIQVQRSTALQHAKATEADYRALLQPAIDQLAAYGEGGIKAETIADLLSGLPAAVPILKD